jgi:hypothetical protein
VETGQWEVGGGAFKTQTPGNNPEDCILYSTVVYTSKESDRTKFHSYIFGRIETEACVPTHRPILQAHSAMIFSAAKVCGRYRTHGVEKGQPTTISRREKSSVLNGRIL